MSKIRKRDVLEMVCSALVEMEAGDMSINEGEEWYQRGLRPGMIYCVGANSLEIEHEGERFRITVTKPRTQK